MAETHHTPTISPLRMAALLQALSGEPQMHERLGEFICNYAKVEQSLHIMFDALCGLDRRVARTIMGNARIADLLPVLTRLVDFSELPAGAKADYHNCINHLGDITKLRHGLIHRGADISDGVKVTSSNQLIAKSKEAIEVLTLHLDDIKAAAHDCSTINIRLMLVLRGELKSSFDADAAEALYSPWRYKPVQPSKPYQAPQKTRQAKKRPRSSSRA